MTEATPYTDPPRQVAFRQILSWSAWTDSPVRASVEGDVLAGLHRYVDEHALDADWATLRGPREISREWLVDTGDPDPDHPGETLVLHLPWPPEDDPDRPPTLLAVGATVWVR